MRADPDSPRVSRIYWTRDCLLMDHGLRASGSTPVRTSGRSTSSAGRRPASHSAARPLRQSGALMAQRYCMPSVTAKPTRYGPGRRPRRETNDACMRCKAVISSHGRCRVPGTSHSFKPEDQPAPTSACCVPGSPPRRSSSSRHSTIWRRRCPLMGRCSRTRPMKADDGRSCWSRWLMVADPRCPVAEEYRPFWSVDGATLFFESGDQLMAAAMTGDRAIGAIRPVLRLEGGRAAGVHPRGAVPLRRATVPALSSATLTIQWISELRSKLGPPTATSPR